MDVQVPHAVLFASAIDTVNTQARLDRRLTPATPAFSFAPWCRSRYGAGERYCKPGSRRMDAFHKDLVAKLSGDALATMLRSAEQSASDGGNCGAVANAICKSLVGERFFGRSTDVIVLDYDSIMALREGFNSRSGRLLVRVDTWAHAYVFISDRRNVTADSPVLGWLYQANMDTAIGGLGFSVRDWVDARNTNFQLLSLIIHLFDLRDAIADAGKRIAFYNRYWMPSHKQMNATGSAGKAVATAAAFSKPVRLRWQHLTV